MKKKLYCVACLCSLVSIILCACGKKTDLIDMSTAESDEYMSIIWEDRTYIPFYVVSKNDCGTHYPIDQWIAMVMADDVLYLDTGYEKEADKRPDTFEGVINSEVDRREKPTVNDQSNFGTGYGYRYGKTEGIIEVYMNDKWQVFATEKIIASDTLILDTG